MFSLVHVTCVCVRSDMAYGGKNNCPGMLEDVKNILL